MSGMQKTLRVPSCTGVEHLCTVPYRNGICEATPSRYWIMSLGFLVDVMIKIQLGISIALTLVCKLSGGPDAVD